MKDIKRGTPNDHDHATLTCAALKELSDVDVHELQHAYQPMKAENGRAADYSSYAHRRTGRSSCNTTCTEQEQRGSARDV
jgi:cytochrome c553